MELTLSRETLCFERLALSQREQVSVEGEATLPGSMRDAVTVLSVQAQAYLEKAEVLLCLCACFCLRAACCSKGT